MNTPVREAGGAESGALTPPDPDLTTVIEAWLALPGEIRAAILTLVNAGTGTRTTRDEGAKQGFGASSPGSRGKG
jgi:hypothetical protein